MAKILPEVDSLLVIYDQTIKAGCIHLEFMKNTSVCWASEYNKIMGGMKFMGRVELVHLVP